MNNTIEPKKKRGRKPKNIINNTKIDVTKENKIDKNMIIRIKLNEKDELLNILPGYSGNDLDEYKNNKEYNCWNCCHSIKNIYSIPLKYENEKFYIYGDFCCLGCSLRYIIDNNKNHELWEKYELFNLYYRKIYGNDISINIPPSRLCLKYFGGNLTIDEYREEIIFNEMDNPIIIPVKNYCKKKENNYSFNNKGDLKLYRKSKKENKTIFNNMNIK